MSTGAPHVEFRELCQRLLRVLHDREFGDDEARDVAYRMLRQMVQQIEVTPTMSSMWLVEKSIDANDRITALSLRKKMGIGNEIIENPHWIGFDCRKQPASRTG